MTNAKWVITYVIWERTYVIVVRHCAIEDKSHVIQFYKKIIKRWTFGKVNIIF